MLIDVSLDDTWQVFAELALSSEPDHGHLSMDPVMEAIRELNLPIPCLERLRQSVAEAVRNAMQHGNKHGPKAPVLVRVLVSNIEARQIERQSPGGWGFFLIERTAQTPGDLACYIIELHVYREGAKPSYNTCPCEYPAASGYPLSWMGASRCRARPDRERPSR